MSLLSVIRLFTFVVVVAFYCKLIKKFCCSLAEVSKAEGRVGQTTNMVIGGTVTDDSANEWLALDKKVTGDFISSLNSIFQRIKPQSWSSGHKCRPPGH